MGGSSAQAAMARIMSTEHRWCVKVKPEKHDVGELTALLRFLHVSPFTNAGSAFQKWLVVSVMTGLATDRERRSRRLRLFLRRFLRRRNTEHLELPLPCIELSLPSQTSGAVLSDITAHIGSAHIGYHGPLNRESIARPLYCPRAQHASSVSISVSTPHPPYRASEEHLDHNRVCVLRQLWTLTIF